MCLNCIDCYKRRLYKTCGKCVTFNLIRSYYFISAQRRLRKLFERVLFASRNFHTLLRSFAHLLTSVHASPRTVHFSINRMTWENQSQFRRDHISHSCLLRLHLLHRHQALNWSTFAFAGERWKLSYTHIQHTHTYIHTNTDTARTQYTKTTLHRSRRLAETVLVRLLGGGSNRRKCF